MGDNQLTIRLSKLVIHDDWMITGPFVFKETSIFQQLKQAPMFSLHPAGLLTQIPLGAPYVQVLPRRSDRAGDDPQRLAEIGDEDIHDFIPWFTMEYIHICCLFIFVF